MRDIVAVVRSRTGGRGAARHSAQARPAHGKPRISMVRNSPCKLLLGVKKIRGSCDMRASIKSFHMIPGRLFTLLLIIIQLIGLCGCTTIPGRFQPASHINDRIGYVVEKEDDKGFYLETFYYEYSFFPNADKSIENGRAYFAELANEIASKRGRQINPIIKSSLNVNATRNIIDGKYSVYVSGRVDFPIGGFSPPEGRLARGFKPPAFSRFLFQSAVKSAESF
jgi:hypothetical protein